MYPTIDPENPAGFKVDVTIPGDLLERWFKYNLVQYENLRCVKRVLDDPKRIFKGIVRPVSKDGWCYVGKPERWHIKENVDAPFPNDKVFAVFLNDRFHLYNFRAEEIDLEDALSPRDWKNRFGGLIWKSTS